MRRSVPLLLCLASLLAGALLRPWWDAHTGRPPASSAQATVPRASNPSRPVAAAREVSPPPAPTRAAAHTEAAPPQGEVAALRQELEALKATLASERKLRLRLEGSPLYPPPGLAPRFDGERLREALARALREAGAKARVTRLDCSEYPCLVYGEGLGDPGDMARLIAAPSFAPYAGDSRKLFGWLQGEGPAATRHFALALWPREGGQDETALRNRLEVRTWHMRESARTGRQAGPP